MGNQSVWAKAVSCDVDVTKGKNQSRVPQTCQKTYEPNFTNNKIDPIKIAPWFLMWMYRMKKTHLSKSSKPYNLAYEKSLHNRVVLHLVKIQQITRVFCAHFAHKFHLSSTKKQPQCPGTLSFSIRSINRWVTVMEKLTGSFGRRDWWRGENSFFKARRGGGNFFSGVLLEHLNCKFAPKTNSKFAPWKSLKIP